MGWMDAIQQYFTRNEPQPQPTPQQAAIQQAMGVYGPPAPTKATPAPTKKAAAPKPKPKAVAAPVSTGPQNLKQPVIVTPPGPEQAVADMQKGGLEVPNIVRAPGWHSTIEGTGTQEDINQNRNVTQNQDIVSSEDQNKNQVIDTGRKMGVYGDPEYQQLVRRANALDVQSMADQSAGLKTIKEGVDAYQRQTPQLDLSPLAALVDAQTGSKFSQTYKVPDGARRLAAENVAADSGVQKLQNDFTKDQLALLRSQIQGYDQKQLLEMIASNNGVKKMSGQTETDTNTMKDAKTGKVSSNNMPQKTGGGKPQVNNEMEKIWTQFQMQAKPEIDGMAAIPTTMALVNQNTQVSSESAIRQILRVSGDTRPSDADVQAYAKGNKELAQRMEQALDSAFEGKAWSIQNQKEVKNVLKAFADGARDRYSKKVDGFSQSARIYQPTLSLSSSQVRQALMNRSGAHESDLAAPVEKPKKSLMEEYMEFKKAGAK